jgi:hypothetical protein
MEAIINVLVDRPEDKRVHEGSSPAAYHNRTDRPAFINLRGNIAFLLCRDRDSGAARGMMRASLRGFARIFFMVMVIR